MNRQRFLPMLALFALLCLSLCPLVTQAQSPNIDAPRLHYTTTWIGNTFPGLLVPGSPSRKHVQIAAEALFVAPDGTCYLNSNWDEDGYEAGIYRNGDVIGNCEDLHGWGRSGGKAICATDKYIYVAMSQRGDDGGNYPAKNSFGKFQYPPKDHIWRCVRRYDLTGKPAPFPGGSGHDGSMCIVEDLALKGATLAEDSAEREQTGITALTVDSARGRLFVCTPQGKGIQALDTETMMPLSLTLQINRPKISFSPQSVVCGIGGDFWAFGMGSYPSQEIAWPVLVHFASDGVAASELIGTHNEFPFGQSSLSLNLDDKRHRLFVAGGDSPDQQVFVFDVAGAKPRIAARVGVKGGIFAGPKRGVYGPLRFNNPVGAGCDRDGNLIVASSGSVATGGLLLESYAPNTTGVAWTRRIWRLMGIEFVDGGDFDPATDGRDLYTKEEHFSLDLDRPAGSDSTYVGYTVDRFRYPNDPRLYTDPATAFVRRINGKPILYTTDMYIGPLTISRFDTSHMGEIAIPCGTIAKSALKRGGDVFPASQPSSKSWFWRDRSGDGDFAANEFESALDGKPAPTGWGWCVDSRGDIWQATDRDGIRHFPGGGLDALGSPIYSFQTMETVAMPAPLTELCRAEYVPETDTMFLTGYTTDHPHTGGEWGAVGTEALRYDHWKAGNRTPNLRIPLLYDGQKQPLLFIKSFSIAGDYVFAAEGRDPERIFVYDTRSGKLQGILQPDATVGSHSGWIDHPYGIRAFRRKNGEYLVLAEEDLDAKLILYRWKP